MFRRSLSTSICISTKFDPKVFVDPITDLSELKKPLSVDDPRNFLHPKPMKSDYAPVFYHEHVVNKMVRCFMMDGRKELSRSHVLYALEKIKRTQYKKWKEAKTEEEKSKLIVDPVTLTKKAMLNCRPLLKILPVVRGGITYKVPFPVVEVEAEFRAIKMMKLVCREKSKKGNFFFRNILTQELIDASNNEGFTILAKQEHHKLCEANRAFSHYRKK